MLTASLSAKTGDSKPGTSGIVRDPNPEKKRDLPDESQANALNDLAENTLLALVRTGIGNDFEEVVFPQYPSLRKIKRQLMGSDSDGSDESSAIYAALSGSGSALFGLYRSEADAKAAQQRVQSSGVQALLTETLPRAEYWDENVRRVTLPVAIVRSSITGDVLGDRLTVGQETLNLFV